MLRAAMPNFSLGITRGLQMAQVKRPASALTRPLGLVYFHVKDGTVRTPKTNQDGNLEGTRVRPGEEKLGQIQEAFITSDLVQETGGDLSACVEGFSTKGRHHYVFFGGDNDIGSRANWGRGKPSWDEARKLGCNSDVKTADDQTLNQLANTAFNKKNEMFLRSLAVLGCLDISTTKKLLKGFSPENPDQQEALCQAVRKVHVLSSQIVQDVFRSDPLARLSYLNGDHDSMCPIVEGFYNATGQKPIVIYVDLHGDSRSLDQGPHSGNWCTHIHEQGWLKKAYLVGLSPLNNNAETLDNLTKLGVTYEEFTWERLISDNDAFNLAATTIITEIQEQHPESPVILSICGDSILGLPASDGNTHVGYRVDVIYGFIKRIQDNTNLRIFNVAELKPGLEGSSKGVSEFLLYALFLAGGGPHNS